MSKQDQIEIPPAIRYLVGAANNCGGGVGRAAIGKGGRLSIDDQSVQHLARVEADSSLTRVVARLLLGLVLDAREAQVPEDVEDRTTKITAVRREFQRVYGSADSDDTRSVESYALAARRVAALPVTDDALEYGDDALEALVGAAGRGWAAFRAAITPHREPKVVTTPEGVVTPPGATPASTPAPAAKVVEVAPEAPSVPSTPVAVAATVDDALAGFLAACAATVATDKAAAKAKLLAARAAIDAALAGLDPEPDPVVEPAPVVEDGLDAFFADLASPPVGAEVGGTACAPVATQKPVEVAPAVPRWEPSAADQAMAKGIRGCGWSVETDHYCEAVKAASKKAGGTWESNFRAWVFADAEAAAGIQAVREAAATEGQTVAVHRLIRLPGSEEAIRMSPGGTTMIHIHQMLRSRTPGAPALTAYRTRVYDALVALPVPDDQGMREAVSALVDQGIDAIRRWATAPVEIGHDTRAAQAREDLALVLRSLADLGHPVLWRSYQVPA